MPAKYDNYGIAEVLAGIDLPLTHRLDLRALEIGVGHALNTADSTKPTLVTVSSGIIVHFGSRSHELDLPH